MDDEALIDKVAGRMIFFRNLSLFAFAAVFLRAAVARFLFVGHLDIQQVPVKVGPFLERRMPVEKTIQLLLIGTLAIFAVMAISVARESYSSLVYTGTGWYLWLIPIQMAILVGGCVGLVYEMPFGGISSMISGFFVGGIVGAIAGELTCLVCYFFLALLLGIGFGICGSIITGDISVLGEFTLMCMGTSLISLFVPGPLIALIFGMYGGAGTAKWFCNFEVN